MDLESKETDEEIYSHIYNYLTTHVLNDTIRLIQNGRVTPDNLNESNVGELPEPFMLYYAYNINFILNWNEEQPQQITDLNMFMEIMNRRYLERYYMEYPYPDDPDDPDEPYEQPVVNTISDIMNHQQLFTWIAILMNRHPNVNILGGVRNLIDNSVIYILRYRDSNSNNHTLLTRFLREIEQDRQHLLSWFGQNVNTHIIARIYATLIMALRNKIRAIITRLNNEAVIGCDVGPCAICMGPLDPSDDPFFEENGIIEYICQLPCGHCFHRSCIHPWLRTRLMCPSCRAPVTVDSEIQCVPPRRLIYYENGIDEYALRQFEEGL